MRKIDIVIITGASRGIGLSLLEQLQKKGTRAIGLARTKPTEAQHFIQVDLLETEKLPAIIKGIVDQYKEEATSFTLFNNAGTVEPIGLVGTVESAAITDALAINLTAPIVFSNTFITELADFEGPKKIINISSGAGRKAYEGWGIYCTTKAGLDHFSSVVSLEQATEENPVDIVAIAPGIIDTGMQETIRSSHQAAFPLLERFVEYKAEGMLSSPEETARKLIRFMEEADFKKIGPIADIREF